MNQQNYLKLLREYRKVDLSFTVYKKKRELLKQKLALMLKEDNMDSFSINNHTVSVSEFEKEMYLKAKLEKTIDSKLLEKCKKVIKISRVNVSYKEDK